MSDPHDPVERRDPEDAVFADRAFYKPVVGGIRLGFGEGENTNARGSIIYLPNSTVVGLRDLLTGYLDRLAAAEAEKSSTVVKKAIARNKRRTH